LLSALLGSAAVIAVYFTARLLWSRYTAIIAALILAVSPALVEAAHYAKWESMMLFLSCVAWFFAIKIYAGGKLRHYILCGLATGFCASTHYMGGFFSVLLPVAHVARAARYYMQAQVEAGHGCPITMTFAATPSLAKEPDLARHWLPKIHARVYDPRNVLGKSPLAQDIRALLRMADPVRAPPADIVEERPGHDQFLVGTIALSGVLHRAVTDCLAMGDHLRAAPGTF